MRVGFPGGPRLEWYDRNPQPKEGGYAGSAVAPHTLTQRFTYTVPTGKKFFLENAYAYLMRYAAADAAERVMASISARGQSLAFTQIMTNAVGDKDSMNVGRSVIMQAADVLLGNTSDASTAGSVDYSLNYHGIEFDA